MVILEAARSSSCSQTGPRGYTEYTELDTGFFALLGSVLGCTAMRMLLDHKSETGYRTVDRIVAFETDKEPDEATRSWMLVPSDCRQPPADEEVRPAPGILGWVQRGHQYIIQVPHSE